MSELNSHIDISVDLRGNQIDLRIPTEVTFERLKTLIAQNLLESGVNLPLNWEMSLKDKHFQMESTDYVDEFPIGNGDVFVITAGKQ